MIASELIAHLEKMIEAEGDHEVLIEYDSREWLPLDDEHPTGVEVIPPGAVSPTPYILLALGDPL